MLKTSSDDYYYQRAETELERAQRADHPAAVRAHYIMAGHYLDLTYGLRTQDECEAVLE